MSLKYYVLDLETTGLKTSWHEVTQISIIRCSDRHQLNRYIRAQFPDRADPQALEVTGRTKADLKKGVSKEEAVEACHNFFLEDGVTPEHRCVVAHNASFDRRFGHDLWASCKKQFPANCWQDTMSCVRQYAKYIGMDKPSVKLMSSLEIVGAKPKSNAQSHNAVSDTQHTYILREQLIKQGFDILPFIKRVPHEEERSVENEGD